jgi:hypothetical protein
MIIKLFLLALSEIHPKINIVTNENSRMYYMRANVIFLSSSSSKHFYTYYICIEIDLLNHPTVPPPHDENKFIFVRTQNMMK